MTTRLPVVLENLRIATPCRADWDEMSGDDTVRFCGRCEKNVYDLSAMTRAEGEALVREKEGRVCVRLYQRRDGTVLTADCPVGARRARLRHRVWASVAGAAASLALLFGLGAGRARGDLAVRGGKNGAAPQTTKLMGHVAPPKTPARPPTPPVVERPEPIMGDVSIEPTK